MRKRAENVPSVVHAEHPRRGMARRHTTLCVKCTMLTYRIAIGRTTIASSNTRFGGSYRLRAAYRAAAGSATFHIHPAVLTCKQTRQPSAWRGDIQLPGRASFASECCNASDGS